MKRREFITMVGGATVAWPLAARAQRPKILVVGFLGTTSPSSHGHLFAKFVQRLRELGWIEGRNVAFEYRWAEGRTERVTEIVTEFTRLKVDVILTHDTRATIEAKQATSVIPIVFALAADPLGSGLVASLARPGGNVTGMSLQFSDLAGKRLELLREVVPGLNRLAIMANANSTGSVLEMGEILAIARTLGIEVTTLEIQRAEDIVPSFGALKNRADALYVVAEALLASSRIRINTLALGARLPTMHGAREFVEDGGLISYGTNLSEMFRHAAEYVDKILRGAKPADLPVQQPTKFEMIINLKTAKALGLSVPPKVLARADEVIE